MIKISDHDVASDLGVYIPYNLDPYDCLPGVHHNEVDFFTMLCFTRPRMSSLTNNFNIPLNYVLF